MRLLLNGLYAVLLTVLSPVIVWRMIRHGRYRRGLAQKLFGRLPRFDRGAPVVWFHAVSVGEIVQLQKVVAEFRRQRDDGHCILITTSTDTGYDLAIQRFDDCAVTWFPLDFTWAVRAAVQRVQPALVVLMELELWPNFVAECQSRSVPVAVINARMSERSARRYGSLPKRLSPMFGQLALVAAQSESAASRLRALGVSEDRVVVTGSVKFDGVSMERDNAATVRLRNVFNLNSNELVFMAGSTQEPEEQLAIEAWLTARRACPSLRLILVPRHRERFDEVARLIVSHGLPLTRRSALREGVHREGEAPAEPRFGDKCSAGAAPSRVEAADSIPAVILLDTIGELSACWGLADIAFVGGSFGNRGGQNMIEPAAVGAAILFGPNTRNFRDVVQSFTDARACVQLQHPEDLGTTVVQLLTDIQERDRMTHAARGVVQAQQGATAATVKLLMRLLSSENSVALVSRRAVA